MADKNHRAWVEVDPEAVAHNYSIVRRMMPGKGIMPVVKADAYGHGMLSIARRLEQEHPSFFGVANAVEAQHLADAGLTTPPFILGPTPPEEREQIVAGSWGCTVSSIPEAQHFQRIAQGLHCVMSVHLALDTGMGREGFLPGELGEILPQLAAMDALRVDGVMSHFPVADEDEAFTRRQIELFEDCVAEVKRHFPSLRYVHTAASAGLLGFRVPSATLVRPGLMLYGVAPGSVAPPEPLRTTLCLLARVTLVRDLPAGHGVSYGRTFITPQPMRVATIGIGYADGWRRQLGGRGLRICVRGEMCPMLGRVTMDQIMADVSAVPGVQSGDVAELIGPHVPVERVAELAGTIPWDIFTGLGRRLPRTECAMRQVISSSSLFCEGNRF